jgi:phosphatidylglycerophosphate synthase
MDSSGQGGVAMAQHDDPKTEAAEDLACRWVYRPASRRISVRVAKARVAPNHITAAALGLTFIMPFCASLGGGAAIVGVALLAAVIEVLDCVDGDVARATGRATDWGGYLDDFAGTVFEASKLVSLGVLVDGGWRLGGPGLAFGLTAALMGAIDQVGMRLVTGRFELSDRPGPLGWGARAAARGVDGFFPVLLIAAGVANAAAALLGFFVAYRVLRFAASQCSLRARIRAASPGSPELD